MGWLIFLALAAVAASLFRKARLASQADLHLDAGWWFLVGVCFLVLAMTFLVGYLVGVWAG